MKLTLAENIRAFRKERRLTQDQLAEALGVTVGSVYKWESGQSIPELNMLVEIADFFDTSMDALLGYRIKDNDIAAVIQRMREYCRVRNPEALDEAEKVLKKYPNSFEVVHGCARVYAFFGVLCWQPDTGGLQIRTSRSTDSYCCFVPDALRWDFFSRLLIFRSVQRYKAGWKETSSAKWAVS